MTVPVLIDSLPILLADFPGISLVYLFGSQATGQTGPMSDFDLAILEESRQDDFEVQAAFQLAISKLLHTDRVDIVLLNRAPIELAYQIIVNGKLLFRRDLYTQVEFESQVLGRYGDYLPILQSFRQQTLHGDLYGKRVQRYREALRRTQRTLGQARSSSRTDSR